MAGTPETVADICPTIEICRVPPVKPEVVPFTTVPRTRMRSRVAPAAASAGSIPQNGVVDVPPPLFEQAPLICT